MSAGFGTGGDGPASAPIAAITFDFWNTLVAENPRNHTTFVRSMESIASGAGIECAPGAIDDAASGLWQWFRNRWKDNVVTSSRDAAVHLAGMLLSGSSSRPATERGREIAGHELTDGLEQILEAGVDPALTTTADGIGDVLESLAGADVALGIICDVGLTPSYRLRGYLRHHGLLDFFRAWSFSDEVGVFKPDPVIFDHAASSLGIEGASRYAHVGDLKRTDIAGARAAGWTPVRYRGLNDDAGEHRTADIIIDHHSDLATRLGI